MTKENIENLADTIIRAEWEAQTFIIDDVLNIFNKTYQNVYAEMQDKDNHYDVVVYCPYAKNKDSIKKIMIFNKHLLINIGERKYTYRFADDEEYIMSGLICTVYLPLPNNAENILKYSVKNRIIHVEVGKNI